MVTAIMDAVAKWASENPLAARDWQNRLGLLFIASCMGCGLVLPAIIKGAAGGSLLVSVLGIVLLASCGMVGAVSFRLHFCICQALTPYGLGRLTGLGVLAAVGVGLPMLLLLVSGVPWWMSLAMAGLWTDLVRFTAYTLVVLLGVLVVYGLVEDKVRPYLWKEDVASSRNSD